MLKPERMEKVVITAPKTFLDKTIAEMYNLNAMHITDHTKKELDIGEPLESAAKISETLISTRSLISNMGLSGSMKLNNGFRAIGVKNFAQLAKKTRELQEEVNATLEEKKKLEEQMRALETREQALLELEKLGISLDSYDGYSQLEVHAGYVKDPESLAKDISRHTEEFELHKEKSGGSYIIALFAAKHASEKVSELLASHHFTALDLAPVHGLRGYPKEELSAIREKKRKTLEAIGAINGKLGALAKKWHDFLLLSEQFLSIELEKAEAPLRFASSKNIFVASGWVPEKRVKTLKESVEKLAKGNCSVEASKPAQHDNVPVKLEHNKLSRPFEFLMNLYALPKYGEIDPTIFLFITFPLFFGIILGDIGYGITVLLLAMYIKKKIPAAATLARIIMPAAVSSIFFGLLFGEVFGFEELFGYHIPHVISRIHQIETMLYVSVIIGLIHVNIGLLLGFVNELEHGLKKAILSKGSWWLLQLSVAGIAATSAGILNIPAYLNYALAALSIAMIYLGESISGLVEIPGLISNILSYSRLMAVGLASVGLAVVVNGFVEEFMHAGGIMIIPAILVGLLGHALNIALGMLGGFLHSIRLHYVEFFTKFFHGGAVPFRAFGKTTEEVD